MPRVAIADGEIHYEVTGEGHPLVLAAGLSGMGRYWQPQIAAFASRFRVVTYDQRGTGNSDRVQRSFSIDRMAAELVALMDALKIERAHILGHSTGAAICQTIAIEQPQRVARLVLSGAWTHCDPFFRRLFEARRELLLKCGPGLNARFHPLWLYPPQWIGAHDEEIAEEQRRAVMGAPPVEVSVARIDAIMAFNRRAGLSRIKAPTLVVCSDNDYITPGYFSEALARAIPDAKLAIAHGAGHAFSKTRPEEFNRLVLDFLAATG